jgi:hypothetical protein
VVAPDDAASLDEVLKGDFVRALRVEALSLLANGAAIRNTNPVVADAFILSAMRLKARADEIEWLAATYVHLGKEVEFWTRVIESPREYIQMITGINP